MDKKESQEKPRRILRAHHIILIVFVVFLTFYLLYRYKLKSQLEAKLNEIRASGYPVTCEELDRWYSLPQMSDNAADVIIDAFSFYEKWEDERREILPVIGRGELPHRTQPLSEEAKTVITQYLADNRKALDLLHKAAGIQHSRYPVDYSQGFGASVPYLYDIRTGARLLQLEAIIYAENDRTELAAKSVRAMLGIARSLSKEPGLTSQLININCKALAILSLERAMNRTDFTDSQLRYMDKVLANAQDFSTMSNAFTGERCAGVAIFKMPLSEMNHLLRVMGNPGTISVVPIAFYKMAGLADMDAIIYLDIMSDYMNAYKLPLHERLRAFETIEAKIGTLSKVHIILHEILPFISSKAITIDLKCIAHLLVARTAIAVQRYCLNMGNYPESLADLVPDYLDFVMKDPFDGNDLRHKKLDTGFVVYSIGEDGVDDGGKERKAGAASSNYDITFIIGM